MKIIRNVIVALVERREKCSVASEQKSHKFLQQSILIFVIALCGSVPEIIVAQTVVCSGDSVALILKGYKQGTTQWQQSPDQSTWTTASGTTENDSLIITATNTYYYRAKVADGTCTPFYSDIVLIAVNPVASTPNANSASNITASSFDVNWTASADATNYYLDVASDTGFTAFVEGDSNRNVGNTTTYSVTGLSGMTTYYYRVRAKNSCGLSSNSNTIVVTTDIPTSCTVFSKCSGTITDSRGGKIYKTIQIGSQCWMAENLNVGKILSVNQHQTPGIDNQNADIEKYCYGDKAANCSTHGGLYLWDEMMAYDTSRTKAPGPRGICPIGWHLPVASEWSCLEANLGVNAGGKLKDTSELWISPNIGATNTSGFTALPGGYRAVPGNCLGFGNYGGWWTATESDATIAYSNFIYNNNAQVQSGFSDKPLNGLSVRCLKD